MTFNTFYCCFGILLVTAYGVSGDKANDDDNDFRDFSKKHGRNFTINSTEYSHRKGIYLKNRDFVNSQQNNATLGCKFAVNDLAFYSPEEMKVRFGLKPPASSALAIVGAYGIEVSQATETNGRSKRAGTRAAFTVPSSWRPGSVNLTTSAIAVKDQGQCGSCWSFSGTALLEYFYYKKTSTNVPLSEQNIVDCQTASVYGCNGGYVGAVLDYYFSKGQDYASVYPYTSGIRGSAGTCKYKSTSTASNGRSPTATPHPTNYYYLSTKNETIMAYAVQQYGWLAAAVNANNWQFYSGGIMSVSACGLGTVNHAVIIVGFGTSGTTPYWIIRNSWGKNWGENGYIRIVRNANACNIASPNNYYLA